jgi:hypothetical protein
MCTVLFECTTTRGILFHHIHTMLNRTPTWPFSQLQLRNRILVPDIGHLMHILLQIRFVGTESLQSSCCHINKVLDSSRSGPDERVTWLSYLR